MRGVDEGIEKGRGDPKNYIVEGLKVTAAYPVIKHNDAHFRSHTWGGPGCSELECFM